MMQVIPGCSSNPLNTAATEYIAFWPNESSSWNATETSRRQLIGAGVLKHLRIFLSAAPGAGAYTFNLRKNGGATSVTVPVTDPATTGVDLVNEESYAVGDRLTLQCVPTGSPTNTPQAKWCAVFESLESFETCTIIGGVNIAMGTLLNENNDSSGGGNWAATAVGVPRPRSVVACEGTLKDFYVFLPGAPGAGTSYDIAVQRNNTAGGLTVNIADAAVTGSDTSGGDTVSRGDHLSLEETPNSTPTARQAFWTIGYTSRRAHEFMLMAGSRDLLNVTGAAEYNSLQGSELTWDATESNRSCLMPQCTIHRLIVLTSGTIAGGTTYVFTVYKNGSATSLTCTVTSAGTSAEDTTNFVEFEDGDSGSIECVATGTPTARAASWSVVCRKAFYSLANMGAGI